MKEYRCFHPVEWYNPNQENRGSNINAQKTPNTIDLYMGLIAGLYWRKNIIAIGNKVKYQGVNIGINGSTFQS